MMKINKKQKLLLLENLSSLLNSGIPIIQCLEIISFQTKNKNIIHIINYIRENISKGENIYNISIKLNGVFNSFDSAMIETGEATGQIGKALETISIKEEKEHDLKRKVKQALIYPVGIVIITFVMLTVIMTYVIPKIEVIYRDAHVNLPSLTQIIISISHFFVNNIVYILAIIAISVPSCTTIYKKVPKIKLYIDTKMLSIPIFGEIIKKQILIHFADFLATLLGSGIMINKALQIIKNAMDNSLYSSIMDDISDEVKKGQPLSTAMGVNILDKGVKLSSLEQQNLEMKNFAFPIELSTAVRIGEQTGTLSKMLQKTSNRYTKEVDNTIKNLSTMLEPVIIVVIGVIVGIIIMAILLPFLNIANVVK